MLSKIRPVYTERNSCLISFFITKVALFTFLTLLTTFTYNHYEMTHSKIKKTSENNRVSHTNLQVSSFIIGACKCSGPSILKYASSFGAM